MAVRAKSRTEPDLDLPPPYRLVTLRELGDAFGHACRIAPDAGAGTLVWVRRVDIAEFAVVLEPGEPMRAARRAFFAGMNAVADAISAHCAPEKPVTFDWPDSIRLDGGLLGGGRLGWPTSISEDECPPWLVFAAVVRTMFVIDREPGHLRQATALDEEGAETADAGALIASAARHLMVQFDAWSETGFQPVAERYLARLDGRETGGRRGLGPEGDLILRDRPTERQSLLPGLRSPTWLDPKTGMPWL